MRWVRQKEVRVPIGVSDDSNPYLSSGETGAGRYDTEEEVSLVGLRSSSLTTHPGCLGRLRGLWVVVGSVCGRVWSWTPWDLSGTAAQPQQPQGPG